MARFNTHVSAAPLAAAFSSHPSSDLIVSTCAPAFARHTIILFSDAAADSSLQGKRNPTPSSGNAIARPVAQITLS